MRESFQQVMLNKFNSKENRVSGKNLLKKKWEALLIAL
jgi:hypothetical protein